MLSTTCRNVELHPVNNVVLHPVNNHCSQLFTFNNHCSIIVDNDQQAFFINYCQLLFQQHCNNHCSLSTSNNYWSNNTHQHCEFNKCCWTLITTLFRRCSANNVASTWRIFARVFNSWVSRDVIISLGVNSKSMHSHRRDIVFYSMCWPCVWQQICAISWDLFTPV